MNKSPAYFKTSALLSSVLIYLFAIQCSAIELDSEALFLSNLTTKTSINTHYNLMVVSNSQQLIKAISVANKTGNTVIQLQENIYPLLKAIQITADNIHLVSRSNNPFKTILRGNGMKSTKGVDNLIRVSGSGFLLDGVLLENVGNHLIQIAGESGANVPKIRNSIFQNGYQQLIKVTYNKHQPNNFSEGGIIEHCLFRYTDSIGPNFYIGGIDAHGIQNWRIQKNIFENIASPAKHIAEHAIHIWNNTMNNIVSNNVIINSDRGIGFGMRNGTNKQIRFGNYGGKISNNIIYHDKNSHPFADTGIIIEESADTVIKNNTILLAHDYPYAIEYRFESSTGVIVTENLTNKGIRTRDGAKGLIFNNRINKKLSEQIIINQLDTWKNSK